MKGVNLIIAGPVQYLIEPTGRRRIRYSRNELSLLVTPPLDKAYSAINSKVHGSWLHTHCLLLL